MSVAAGLAVPSVAGAQAPKPTTEPGGACTVTEGPNKGKKGTYTTDDEGNLWCEGDWGGTECGTDRCKSAFVRPMTVAVMPTRMVAAR